MTYFQIHRLAGASLRDCALLVHRSNFTDFDDGDSTDWLAVRGDAAGMRVVGEGSYGWGRDLWLSPAGRLYVPGTRAGETGLHVGVPEDGGYRWSMVPEASMTIATRIEGVWGLADDFVFAWGRGDYNAGR